MVLYFLFWTLWPRLLAACDVLLLSGLIWLLDFFPTVQNQVRFWPLKFWPLKTTRVVFWRMRLFQFWCRALLRVLGLRIRFHQHYAGRLPAQYILISNHPSIAETLALPAWFPVRMFATHEVSRWPVLKRIARAGRLLYVDRESGESQRGALRTLIRTVQDGDCVGIFPEGMCPGRCLAPNLKPGAFLASLCSGVPILPLYLYYPQQETFEWGSESVGRILRRIASTPEALAEYHIFEPVNPTRFDTPQTMMAHVHQQYLVWQARWGGKETAREAMAPQATELEAFKPVSITSQEDRMKSVIPTGVSR